MVECFKQSGYPGSGGEGDQGLHDMHESSGQNDSIVGATDQTGQFPIRLYRSLARH
jgi:hypothetical protein